jgi:hypothetical protein
MLHLVRPGDSYWSIAEEQLTAGGTPSARDIAVLSESLMQENAPLLGHVVDTLLLPGDTLLLPGDTLIVPSTDAPWAAPHVVVVPTAASVHVPVATPAPLPAQLPAPAVATTVNATARPTTTPTTTATTTPATTPATTLATTRATTARSAESTPINRDLASAVLLCAGALGLIESRRRRVLRSATSDSALAPHSPTVVATERVLRSGDPVQRAVRLDLALRNIGHALGRSGGHVLAAVMHADGELTMMLDRATHVPSAPWTSTNDPRSWYLGADVGDDDLATDARLAGQPCPTLVQLGTIVAAHAASGTATPAGPTPGIIDGELFIDLEGFGLLCIDGPREQSADIIRGIVASLQMSPVGQTVNIVGHSLPESSAGEADAALLGTSPIEHADTLDEALDRAAVVLGSTPTAIGGRRTFELRARGTGGETWEPAVLVSGDPRHHRVVLNDLVSATRGGGRGLAVVLVGRVEQAALTLAGSDDTWRLDGLGLTIRPIALTSSDRSVLTATIASSAEVITVQPPRREAAQRPADGSAHVDTPWELLVSVLGGAGVISRNGGPVSFERGKSLELVTWLSQHRERPTRSAARTALWELAVRDSTFANVVSDARRTMARVVAPPDGEEWIERTLSEDLPLHPLVVSDAELLRARWNRIAGLDAQQVIDVLRPGLEQITGMPFASTNYLWADAEGIASTLIMLVTSAATECARCALELDDIETVFWATGQGLKVLSGHEELIGLRMRAHAQRGDLAGVRCEFEAYERALHADQWSDEEPSAKLVQLRRELLVRRVRTIA